MPVLSLSGVVACSAGFGADEDGNLSDPGSGPVLTGTGGSTASGGGGNVPPPEVEVEESFLAPVVSGTALWTANPDTNKVARILADSMEIEVLPAGNRPTYLASLPVGPTDGGALVINSLSHDVSVFLVDDKGAVVSAERFGVQEGASAWAVGPRGKRAIAWSRADSRLLDSLDGYQDLTVFSFSKERVDTLELSVGFRPSRVFIAQDERHAYVVSEPGISVIDLEGTPAIAREIFLPSGSTAAGRDVSFLPDGSMGFVRIEGSSEVLVVDMESGDTVPVALPGVVTDLDLSADGRWAFAMIRDGVVADGAAGMGGALGMGGAFALGSSLLVVIDTGTILQRPKAVRVFELEEYAGSVVSSGEGRYLLLFTNALINQHLSIFDTQTGEVRVVDVKAPVLSAFISDNGEFAVALMKPPSGSSKAGAFALVPVQEVLPPRIEGTNQVPRFVTLAEEQGRALITTDGGAQGRSETFFARFPELQVDRVALPSRALSAGVVAEAGRAFVAQQHPEGRVTFLDLEAGAETTVTGFELGSKVVR